MSYRWPAYVLSGVLLAFVFGSACQLHSRPGQAPSSPPPEPAPNAAVATHDPTCPVMVDSCNGATDSECLEPVVVPGSAANPVVYRYRDLRQWDDGGKLPLP